MTSPADDIAARLQALAGHLNRLNDRIASVQMADRRGPADMALLAQLPGDALRLLVVARLIDAPSRSASDCIRDAVGQLAEALGATKPGA